MKEAKNKFNSLSVQKIQDKIFRKMPLGKKLKLLNQFLKLANKLQSLNNRKRIDANLWR